MARAPRSIKPTWHDDTLLTLSMAHMLEGPFSELKSGEKRPGGWVSQCNLLGSHTEESEGGENLRLQAHQPNNACFKLVSKTLANRLNEVLDTLIEANQTVFILALFMKVS
ncbi:hypothetical protein QJS10_CPB15g00843 [Acorus calamus]|uniref:Uncharacterized protein n=1 Tax=Acorus calamus TaxID=4465 RepID=A0AAV9D6E7_ACOCL|nr:hypothetical protein QJS10_CPB15g00843 [Acorus calamus]